MATDQALREALDRRLAAYREVKSPAQLGIKARRRAPRQRRTSVRHRAIR